jgi:uncharacterized protein (DUF1330 family)
MSDIQTTREMADGVSRRTFIKGVIGGGTAASVARVSAAPPESRAIESSTQAVDLTDERLTAYRESADTGRPVVMINLLRFRERAVYPEGSAAEEATGLQAYARYGAATLPLIGVHGGRIVSSGRADFAVIAPPGEEWDRVILVEYPTKQAFVDMIGSAEYQAVAHHRTAALADSRLIATTLVPVPATA